MKVIFLPNGAATRTNIQTLTCPGGATGGVGTAVGTVTLADGGSCQLFVSAPAGVAGVQIFYQATLSRTGNVYSVTAGTLTGDVFGSPAPGGPTAVPDSFLIRRHLADALESDIGLDMFTDGFNDVTQRSNSAPFNFTPTGLSFNRSPIDSANPMDRDYDAAFAPQGYFAHGAVRQRNNGFNFSINPQALAANANSKDSLGIRHGSTGPQSRWVTSLRGRYVDFDDDAKTADRDGHLWSVTSVLGYRFSPNTTAGVFSRYRDGEVKSAALASSLDSTFHGGGVYLTTTAAGGVRLVGAALYERGDNDIAIAGATGSYDSDIITLEARLDKRFTRGRHWIEPTVKLLYHKSDNDGFTDSVGTIIADDTQVLGRVSFGPKIGTTIQRGGTAIRPYANINGIWDFERQDTATLTTGVLLKTEETAINLGGGVHVTYANGMAVRIAGDWFAYDTDLEGWSISGGIGGPLAAFGLGSIAPAALVSLDLSGNQQGASATARIRIPLN